MNNMDETISKLKREYFAEYKVTDHIMATKKRQA